MATSEAIAASAASEPTRLEVTRADLRGRQADRLEHAVVADALSDHWSA
jgi:hypothetical protein